MRPTLASARPAERQDAAILSAYYRAAYTPRGGGEARDHYPFVQLLDSKTLRDQINRRDMCWIAGELDGQVVGSVGVVRNVGGAADRIAEFVGLVVDVSARGRGVARTMLDTACRLIEPETDLMMAETRTADPGGWSAFRSCGFEPLGFEPFAHRTPAGAEPMLFLGKLSSRLAHRPVPSAVSYPGASFALAVTGVEAGNGRGAAAHPEIASRNGRRAAPSLDLASETGTEMPFPPCPSTGVVSLERYEGTDPTTQRYITTVLVGRDHCEPKAYARVSLDRRDRRARIVALYARGRGWETDMLRSVVAHLCSRSARTLRTIVIDVRADAVHLSEALSHLGFFPTICYPQLVAAGDRRVDALQWTRLRAGRLTDVIATDAKITWPRAQRVIEALTPVIVP